MLGGKQSQPGREFDDSARIHIAHTLFAGVPNCGKPDPFVQLLLDAELAPGTICTGDDISGEVIVAETNSHVFPFFGEGRIRIIARVESSIGQRKEYAIANKKSPPGCLASSDFPFYGWNHLEFAWSWRSPPLEIHANFDFMSNTDDHARREAGHRVDRTNRGIKLRIDFALIQNISAGHAKNSLLPVDLKGVEEKNQSCQEERPGNFYE